MPTSRFNTWSDGFQAVRAIAERRRGVDPQCEAHDEERRWPNTTARDVVSIALVFGEAARRLDAAMADYWLSELDHLLDSGIDLDEVYAHNRSFWPTLARIALQLDHQAVPVAPPDAWTLAIAGISGPADASGSERDTEPTWLTMAHQQLACLSDERGSTDHSTGRHPVPLTTTSDVMQLATYWTEQLIREGVTAIRADSSDVVARWAETLRDVAHIAACSALDGAYPLNEDFWEAIFDLAEAADPHLGAPTPCRLRLVRATARSANRRNAAEPASATPEPGSATKIEFPLVATLDDRANAQRVYLGRLRGEDVARPPFARIPRTTNADVAQLAAYWVGVERYVVNSVKTAGLSKRIRDRWRAAVADVEVLTNGADPRAVYPRNAAFWAGLLSIAAELAVYAEAPQPWEMYLDAAEDRFARMMGTLDDVPGAIGDAARRALEEAEKAARAAARGALRALVWPAAIVGGGIALWLVTRSGSHEATRSGT